MSIDKLLIIGGGLIGSSIARAAKVFGQADKVYISDKSYAVCRSIERMGFADGVSENSSELYASEADLIILCVPPGTMAAVAERIVPVMKKGSILTDVASIKGDIIDKIVPLMNSNIHFVPGHPIAGTEYSGPEAGFAGLFKDRWCVLTPDGADESAVEIVKLFWEGKKSRVVPLPTA